MQATMRLGGALCVASVLLTGCSEVADDLGEALNESDVAGYSCEDLATEAVDVSVTQDAAVELLKVRQPRVVKDRRETYKLPTGSAEALILSCTGTGVWSDGTKSPVVLEYTVDSDGDTWVAYKPT